MDLFKLDAPVGAAPMNIVNGQLINGAKSVMWVERYSVPGEFQIKAKVSSGLREFLPVGTLISHTNTFELMIVENHEINEKVDEDPDLIITGRGFVSYLEQRIAGFNVARSNSLVGEYILPAASLLTTQIVELINAHIGSTANASDVLDGVIVGADVLPLPAVPERTITIGPLLDEVQKLLALHDLGIKTIRANPFGPGTATDITIRIYKGNDRSNQIVYSSRAGHLVSVDYLFTNKYDKNSVLVRGRYVQVTFDGGPNYNNRQFIIDGSDLDGHLDTVPTGGVLTAIINRMTTRAMQALSNRESINIARADVATIDPYRYRTDYNLGDLVTLEANYGESAVMRVIEYVEIEDEEGESGHPTFSIPTSA